MVDDADHPFPVAVVFFVREVEVPQALSDMLALGFARTGSRPVLHSRNRGLESI